MADLSKLNQLIVDVAEIKVEVKYIKERVDFIYKIIFSIAMLLAGGVVTAFYQLILKKF